MSKPLTEESEADPVLRASWSSDCPMASVEIHIAANGDPAGVIPGGSGTSGYADFPAPGYPTTEYTAGWIGTTALAACSITEAPNGGGE